jgi:hypothetical protein
MDRYNQIPFSGEEATATEEEKLKRINLPIFAYFDELHKNGTVFTFNEILEVNKYNNQTLGLK